jgi:protein pelota
VLATVSANLPSKRNEPDAFTSKEREFYGDVVAALGEPLAAHAPSGVIVAGPGWAKDKLADLLSEARADLKVHVEGIGSSGETGVNELIKRGTVSRLYSDSRVALEVELVERLLASIAKGDGLSAYGPDHVRQAVECGAASHLLLTDELFRRANVGGGGAELDALMERAARSRGEVVIVSSEHEGGRRLEGLGGLAALLRYPLAWESEPDGAGATG